MYAFWLLLTYAIFARQMTDHFIEVNIVQHLIAAHQQLVQHLLQCIAYLVELLSHGDDMICKHSATETVFKCSVGLFNIFINCGIS